MSGFSEGRSTILTYTICRLSFTDHLVRAMLLQAEMLEQHGHTFPTEELNAIVRAYSTLNKAKLETELFLIYQNSIFKDCCGALPLVLLTSN